MKQFFSCLIAVIILFIVSGCEQGPATVSPINKTYQGVAIYGFDPVAYFLEQKTVKGNLVYNTKWNGAAWAFVSPENKALFKENPEKYAPQFGGYCAYAVSQNTTADIDPFSWDIVDGKLYLNLNKEVQKLWRSDRDNYIKAAHANWPGVLEKK